MRRHHAALAPLIEHPAFAAALAAVIVLCVAVFLASKFPTMRSAQSVTKGGFERETVSKVFVAPQVGSEQGVPLGSATAVSAASSSTASSLAQPQIARVGTISLFVGNVDRAVAALSALARQQTGDVLSLDVGNGGNSVASQGSMQIRIPASRFEQTLASVGRVGTIRQRSINAEDITADITDSDARLRNLRRTEADIRKIMDRSGNVAQVMDAENQLSLVREQIETLESSLKSMRARVAYSTITIDMATEVSGTQVEPSAIAQLGSAWHGALHALSQSTIRLIAMLMLLLVFTPYAIVAAIAGAIVYRWARKRSLAASTTPLT